MSHKLKKSDILLVFPPHWTFNMPYLSLPCLYGALYAAGFDASLLDVNLEFHYWLFSLRGIASLQNRITQRLQSFDSKPKLKQKEIEICRQLFQAIATAKLLRVKVDLICQILKSDDFYQPDFLIQAFELIRKTYEVASAAYAPSEINFISFNSSYDCITPEGLFTAVADQETNLYLNYYKNVTLPYIEGLSPKMIGISICSETQWLPALTLCHILHQSGFNGKIVIGGGIPSRLSTQLATPETSLADYCDIIALGEGEETIVNIAIALTNGESLENVQNIIWYSPKGPVTTYCKTRTPYRNLPAPKFDGLSIERYLSPEPVLPIMMARGCYNRCTFCDHSAIYSYKRSTKGVDQIVEELKTLHSTYKVSTFAFSDEVLPQKTAIKLSEALYREAPKFNLASCFRLEEGWTRTIWDQLVNSGFLLGQFGLESASDRILVSMNKQISSSVAAEVLKTASQAGLWNHIFLMFGFPDEKDKEAKETIHFIREFSENIHSVGASRFHLMRHTPIYNNPNQFGISYSDSKPWSLVIPYESKNGLSPEIADEITEHFQKVIASEMNGAYLWQRLERTQLLLYLKRCSRDNVLEMGNILYNKRQSQNLEPHLPMTTHLQWFQHDITVDANSSDLENILTINKEFPIFTTYHSKTVSLVNNEAAWIITAWNKGHTFNYIVDRLSEALGYDKAFVDQQCREFIKTSKLCMPTISNDMHLFEPEIGTISDLLRQQIDLFISHVHAPKHLPIEAIPEWLSLKSGLKPGVRTVLYSIDRTSIEALAREVKERGMHIRYRSAPIEGFAHLSSEERKFALQALPMIVYIAKSSKETQDLYKAELEGSQALGQSLGYPPCCISWLVELDKLTMHEKRPCNFPIMSSKYTNGNFAAELNNLLWYLPTFQSPLYLISHYPCSYSCQTSIKQAHQLYSLINTHSPEFAMTLKELLSSPILLWDDTHLPEYRWDENKGLIFEGAIENNRIYYKNYISLRRPRDYSELALTFANQLVVEPDRVYTLSKERIAGCWWNSEHGVPHLLPFVWNEKN